MNRSPWNRVGVVLGIVFALVLAGVCVHAAGPDRDPRQDLPEQSATTEVAAVGVAGVIVHVDRRTGRLQTPSTQQALQLRAALGRMFASTRGASDLVTRPDGTLSLVLDERHAVFSIGQVEHDGGVSTRCVSGARDAESAFTEHVAARREED